MGRPRKGAKAAGETPPPEPPPTEPVPEAPTGVEDLAQEVKATGSATANADEVAAALDAGEAPKATEEPPRKTRGPGRPKGSRNRATGDDPATMRKAELVQEVKRLRAQSAEDAPSVEDIVKQAADAIEGTVLTVSSVAESTPYRAFTFTEKEAKTLGQLWAPVMAPHWGKIAEQAPVWLALAGTAQILYPKYATYRRDAAARETVDAEDVSGTDEPPGVKDASL